MRYSYHAKFHNMWQWNKDGEGEGFFVRVKGNENILKQMIMHHKMYYNVPGLNKTQHKYLNTLSLDYLFKEKRQETVIVAKRIWVIVCKMNLHFLNNVR